MANAAGSKGNRGEVKPSQQGRAGLRLAERAARCAHRLCLGHRRHHRPRPRLCRQARALGRRRDAVRDPDGVHRRWRRAASPRWRWSHATSRPSASTRPGPLAYDGVEVEILEHPLTPEQRRIYDAYAGAFKIIHQNIQEALKATGIVDGEDTLNRNAKSAALSAFEGAKQRFFGHLLTAMKCPSLIRADRGRSRRRAVGRHPAGLDRRGADGAAHRRDPGLGMGRPQSVDLTPRDGIRDRVPDAHAFPVQLQEPFTDDERQPDEPAVFDGCRRQPRASARRPSRPAATR